ncbi:MAG TPA: glycerol-3-phosphate dehydrogenase/oxidase [Vicinamibacterales bacterium]|nr:glycerol-3-phosphate dehydrogenase/oxidase [Vicinamibacterales bacterium]
MQRDLRRLADSTFDVIVVGAGFYGVTTAWDAAQRGLSVAIVDKDDFGAATSFNNLKTLHGGLRSLQSFNLPQMRLFIRERRALARILPHLVRPLPFVVTTSRNPRRSALAMRFALAFSDAMARDRNEGLSDPGTHLPGSRIVSKEEALTLNPVVSPDGVTGGALWYDYQMISTDRVTLSFLLSAVDAGACAANYVRVDRFLQSNGRVVGVNAEDRLTSESFSIRGRVVVNAGGPWAASLLADLPPGARGVPPPRLSRAMNIITRKVVDSHACGGLANGRYLFMVPWRDVSMLGTSHDAHEGSADDLKVSRWDLEAFLKDAREAFPLANLTAADIRLVHRGLLPMISGDGTRVRLLRESQVVDHGRHGLPGLISMFGVRYTTARHTAERAVDAVFKALGDEKPPRCRTAETPLQGGSINHMDNFLKAVVQRDVHGVGPETLKRIASTYGTAYDRVLQIARDIPALARPLGRDCDVIGAEILYAARREMAVKLGDAVIRRTEAGTAGHPGSDALERAAAIMARVHEWDEWRMRNEIAEVEAFFRLPRD